MLCVLSERRASTWGAISHLYLSLCLVFLPLHVCIATHTRALRGIWIHSRRLKIHLTWDLGDLGFLLHTVLGPSPNPNLRKELRVRPE